MLDKWDPLSQRGPQWDGDQEGTQGASWGAQPCILSSPWKTGPAGKAATLPREQTQMHIGPGNGLEDSEPHPETHPT